MRSLIALLLLLAPTANAEQRPRNIILFIGDGMGLAHFTMAGEIRKHEFSIGRMPVIGLVTTSAADRAVPDSGSTASALATGVKVNFQALSIDPAGKTHETVLEIAETRGKATGLVTTTAFWDATPAAFAAHSMNRDRHAAIRTEMLSKGIELIASGGLEHFGTQEVPTAAAFAAGAGYTLIDEAREIDAAQGSRLLLLLPTQKRDADLADAPLSRLTKWAIDRLMNDPEGFFLLVEHEGTDTGSHWNDSEVVRSSLTSFDKAVGVALDFAAGRNDTLVIATADHETGGLRLSETKAGKMRLEWSTSEHTAIAVPLFAIGPGAAAFAGYQDNTVVGQKLIGLVK